VVPFHIAGDKLLLRFLQRYIISDLFCSFFTHIARSDVTTISHHRIDSAVP